MYQITLEKTSNEFRKLFLLKLTEEMIRHSENYMYFDLGEYLKEKGERDKEIQLLRKTLHEEPKPLTLKEKVKQVLSPTKKEKYLVSIKRTGPHEVFLPTPHAREIGKPALRPTPKQIPKPVLRSQVKRRFGIPVLRIPKPRLPPRFQYLKPTPTDVSMELGKLNPLVNDPNVRSIECNGPDENIVVRGKMGAKKTQIVLNKEEIDNIINAFSAEAKIPLYGGVFHVVFGRLDIAAIISEEAGSKFIIEKINPPAPTTFETPIFPR